MKTKHSFGYLLLLGAALFTSIQGCNDDGDANEKPPTVKPTGGSSNNNVGGDDNSSGTGGTDNTGGTGNTGGIPEGGGPPEVVGGGGQGGAPFVPECTLPERGEDNCYNCPANGEVEQWLNRCVDSDCVPFDNARLPLLGSNGSLPNLP